MDLERELRVLTVDEAPEVELHVEARADGRQAIRGLGIVYQRLSQDLGGFRERIMPGAFDRILNRQRGRVDLVSFFNHDPNMMLGRESSGTLEVTGDEQGVRYVVTPPSTRADVMELVARRDVRGSSFAFQVGRDGESWTSDTEGPIREIREAAGLFEMGPVVSPAYVQTSAAVGLRSLEAWKRSIASERPPLVLPKRWQLEAAAAAAALRLRNV
jgi:hypothetical protein